MKKLAKPIIITPFDTTVQEAVNELYPKLKDVDIIKLEPNCPPNSLAYVSNKDILKNKPGKEKIIHLCLNKIKDKFKKQFNKNYSLSNPKDIALLKKIIKEFLINVVIPHEYTHIQQELKYKGSFGPSPEQEAQKSEHWEKLSPYGISKKTASLLISNSFYKLKTASLDLYLEHLIQYMKSKKRSIDDLYDKLLKGIKLWPLPHGSNPNKIISNAWKKAILSHSKSPNNIPKLIKSFNLSIPDLEKLILPLEELASLSNLSYQQFLNYISQNDKN